MDLTWRIFLIFKNLENIMVFLKDKKEESRILKLVELARKGRTEPQLRHVCDQWGIKGNKQSKYIKKVKVLINE